MKSKIYTKTGDGGTTSLFDGTRVSKAATRVDAYGTIDEANSWIGFARSFATDKKLDSVLEFLEHRFYNCSSNIASGESEAPFAVKVAEEDILFLEAAIDEFESESGPINGFVLPGGSRCAALLHIARTVCRRAERLICSLSESEFVDSEVRKFINRASDLLFAAARYSNKMETGSDTHWDRSFPIPQL